MFHVTYRTESTVFQPIELTDHYSDPLKAAQAISSAELYENVTLVSVEIDRLRDVRNSDSVGSRPFMRARALHYQTGPPPATGALSMPKIIRTIASIERMPSSRNGNPRYRLTFTDGTSLPTSPDSSLANEINNGEYQESRPVEFTVDGRGNITLAELVAWACHSGLCNFTARGDLSLADATALHADSMGNSFHHPTWQ